MIHILYTAVDGARMNRKFKTMPGARKFAHNMVGRYPEIGNHYAVSGDGIGKIEVTGATLTQLFASESLSGWANFEPEFDNERDAEATRNAEHYRAKAAEWLHHRREGCTCSDTQLAQVGCDCPDAFPF